MKNFKTTIFTGIICFIFYFSIFAGINSGSNLKNSENKIFESPVPTQTVPKNFINCIFNEAYDAWEHKAWILNFLDRYNDSLHFNSIHYYNYFEASSEYGSFNSLMTPIQIQNNIKLLDSVGGNNLKTFTARQNIEKYCYGQRLEYEVSQSGSTTENNGFSYQNVMPNTYTTDSGRSVLHARPWPQANNQSAGWLCNNIYENLQHTDLWDFVQLDSFAWHLKPMIRIDSNNFNNNDTTKVVAIVTKSYDGSRIDSVIVRVNNFGNGGIYKGQYVDKFSFPLGIDLLKTSGSPINGLGKGRDPDSRLWKNNCKVDFKIYWYGLVEVWFDKLTVDDDRANRLFNPGAETPIENFIIQEANTLGSHHANIAFFADEVVYSNIPCIKYVDSVLKSANPDSKLHTASTNYLNVRGMKNDNLGYSVYFQDVKLNSVSNDAHEFSGGGTMIPSNFQNYDSRINPDWIASNNTEYNENLQKRAFGDKNAISLENMDTGIVHLFSYFQVVYELLLEEEI